VKSIKSALHLHTAAIERSYIIVYRDGEPIGDGHIEHISDTLICIGGSQYDLGRCRLMALEKDENGLLFGQR